MCLGMAGGYIEPKEEKKTTLLKRKTNFDKLKDLSVWDFAGKIDEFVQGDFDICPFSKVYGDHQICKINTLGWSCKQRYLRWLESEAEI